MMKKQYGQAFRIYLGTQILFVTLSGTAIKECVVNDNIGLMFKLKELNPK